MLIHLYYIDALPNCSTRERGGTTMVKNASKKLKITKKKTYICMLLF